MTEHPFERAFLVVLHLLGERIVSDQEPFRSLPCGGLVKALGSAERRAGIALILPDIMRLAQAVDRLGVR
jgi:hypothetical protein